MGFLLTSTALATYDFACVLIDDSRLQYTVHDENTVYSVKCNREKLERRYAVSAGKLITRAQLAKKAQISMVPFRGYTLRVTVAQVLAKTH